MKRHSTLIALGLTLSATICLTVAAAAGDPDLKARPNRTPANADLQRATPRYSADELVLLAIQEEGVARVREIGAQLATAQDAEHRRELQQRIGEIKKQTRLHFLETLADQAANRGDLAQADAARTEIENLKNPPRPTFAPALPRAEKKLVQGGK